MRILIDECLNWRLGRALTGHYAISAQKLGWSGIKNGKLLALAVENGFEVFLTGSVESKAHKRPAPSQKPALK
jgi:predicted nuclease of predicted toxin-antitoxin system